MQSGGMPIRVQCPVLVLDDLIEQRNSRSDYFLAITRIAKLYYCVDPLLAGIRHNVIQTKGFGHLSNLHGIFITSLFITHILGQLITDTKEKLDLRMLKKTQFLNAFSRIWL
jgi:hypothetical protein